MLIIKYKIDYIDKTTPAWNEYSCEGVAFGADLQDVMRKIDAYYINEDIIVEELNLNKPDYFAPDGIIEINETMK